MALFLQTFLEWPLLAWWFIDLSVVAWFCTLQEVHGSRAVLL